MAYHATCARIRRSRRTARRESVHDRTACRRVSGAPYADPRPCRTDAEQSAVDDCSATPIRTGSRYKAAVIQTDVVLNKKGWHYPQQRFLTLWGDVGRPRSTAAAARSRSSSAPTPDDAIEFWHTNLVPNYYELDDFQVRTPTDIIGQHIHLVKFDVTSSDGAANGFNYEDGTFSPDEVRELIEGINKCGGLALTANDLTKCNT